MKELKYPEDFYIDEKSIVLAGHIFKNIDELFDYNNTISEKDNKTKINLCLSSIRDSLRMILEAYESTYETAQDHYDSDY